MKHAIWAHRGASGTMPENTLESFKKAAELGADGVELDIQFTKDKQIVVCHDETIDRTSNGKGFVKDYTLEELKQLDFSKTHPEAGTVRIPTMKEVFELLKPTDLMIDIELKTGELDYEGIEEAILQLTKEMGFEDRVIYSSFNHYSILRIQQLCPEAKTAFLYCDGIIDVVEYAKKYHVNALHPAGYNIRFKDMVKDAHEAGMDVNVWTINTKEQMLLCDAYGADAIITNYPELAREVFYGKKSD